MSNASESGGPAELVAIARAAHIAGDRDLEKVAKRELRNRFGIEIKFTRKDSGGGIQCG